MRVLFRVVGVVLAVISTSASAEWMLIDSTNSGSKMYIDPDRVEKSGERVRAWVKIDAKNDASVKYRESKILYSFICTSKKSRVLAYSDYDSYGKTISSRTYPDFTYSDSGYDYLIPDSIGEEVMQFACAVSKIKGE